MKLTLDVENTVTKRDGKMHLDPFEPENSLVMVGMLTDQGDETIVSFDHAECSSPDQESFDLVQGYLDQTTILIAHNAAYAAGYEKTLPRRDATGATRLMAPRRRHRRRASSMHTRE